MPYDSETPSSVDWSRYASVVSHRVVPLQPGHWVAAIKCALAEDPARTEELFRHVGTRDEAETWIQLRKAAVEANRSSDPTPTTPA